MKSEFDIALGKRLRRRRKLKGMTQSEIGTVLGVTFQQIHKYEVGQSSPTAFRLWQFARAVDLPIEELFEEINPGQKA